MTAARLARAVRAIQLPTSKYYRSIGQTRCGELFGAGTPGFAYEHIKIAEMCDVELPIGEDQLRSCRIIRYPVDSGCSRLGQLLRGEVLAEGFESAARVGPYGVRCGLGESSNMTFDAYQLALDREIGIIREDGLLGLFPHCLGFINYAIEKGIPVGPGRGSAAGSLVAYCLGITGIDPLQYDLLFERFLNPERVSMPDIDIDFCIRGRGDVINHVTGFYGRDSVCQIITFGTMASRAAIKDVGRALNMPYGDVERIAKLIPPPIRGRNVSISQALESVPELKARSPRIRRSRT